MCLELGGRTSKVPSANGVEPGGRIVMDDAVSQLRVGKKSMKWLGTISLCCLRLFLLAYHTENPPLWLCYLTEKATDASYMLTINRDYDRVCKEIINQHGGMCFLALCLFALYYFSFWFDCITIVPITRHSTVNRGLVRFAAAPRHLPISALPTHITCTHSEH